MKRIVIYAFMISCAALTFSCDEKKDEEAAVTQTEGTAGVQELKPTKLEFT